MGIQWTCRSIAASFVGGHARGSALMPSASIRPIAQSARERSGLSSRSGRRPLTPTPRSLICRPSEIARTNARCGGEHVRARRHVGARGGYSVPGRGRDLTGRPARPPTPVHPGRVAPIGSPSRARGSYFWLSPDFARAADVRRLAGAYGRWHAQHRCQSRSSWACAGDRGTDEAVRRAHSGRRCEPRSSAWHGVWLSRPQRGWEDDADPDAAGSDAGERR